VDSAETNRKFAQQLAIDYPLLSDPTRVTATSYGVVAAAQPFASRWTFYIGVDGRVLHIDKQVSTATHGRAIAQKLAELGVRKRPRTVN
jgi:peroxiredoxin Q/BCP